MDLWSSPLLLVSVKERTKWVMTQYGGSHQPTLSRAGNQYLALVSFHVFPPRPDPGYSFLRWHSQRGNRCRICFTHIRPNVFFHLFFSFSFFTPFLDRANRDFAGGPKCKFRFETPYPEHSPSQNLLWHKMQPAAKEGGKNKSNNSENQRLSQCP